MLTNKKPRIYFRENFAANPLAIGDKVLKSDGVRAVKQAIREAIASETDAANLYEQIIQMCIKCDVKAPIKVLEDIQREEEKHLGQLYEALKEIDDNDNIQKGEEEGKRLLAEKLSIKIGRK